MFKTPTWIFASIWPKQVITMLSCTVHNRRLANKLTVATVVKNLNMCNQVLGKFHSKCNILIVTFILKSYIMLQYKVAYNDFLLESTEEAAHGAIQWCTLKLSSLRLNTELIGPAVINTQSLYQHVLVGVDGSKEVTITF